MIDLHTHHYRCGHAAGDLRDYVEAALERGITVLGLSDHAPLFGAKDDDAAPGMHMPKSAFDAYLDEASALKEEYAGHIDVLVGVEADYVPGTEEAYRPHLEDARLDYVLGSVHYFGGLHVFDRSRWQHAPDVDAIYRTYFSLVRDAAATGLFDVMAHIDAVKGRGLPPSSDLGEEIEATVDALARSGVSVEINTSGIRKCSEAFPSPRFVRALHHRDVPLTYGSDAHEPSEIGYGWDAVRSQLDGLGVRNLVYYRKRRPHTLPLPARTVGTAPKKRGH